MFIPMRRKNTLSDAKAVITLNWYIYKVKYMTSFIVIYYLIVALGLPYFHKKQICSSMRDLSSSRPCYAHVVK